MMKEMEGTELKNTFREKKVQHVFIVGAKSLGAYGGYETFVDKLTEYHQSNASIKYHVACKANGQGAFVPDGAEIRSDGTYTYHNAECFQVNVPERLSSAQAIFYDCCALRRCIEIIKKEKTVKPIVYVLACRIGPFFGRYVKKIKSLGGKVYLNPDGHEWKRAKWNRLIRAYWKLSEKMMVKKSDLIICDSINIEKYIKESYGVNNTTFIAYGAEIRKSVGADERYAKWLEERGLKAGEYYLVVGRFVPENNYETMLREFINSKSKKDFALITNENSALLEKLYSTTKLKEDKRIKFTGTVYDPELLKKIRESAFAYLHGHEVGGTNPSLVEALGSTEVNLLLDVGFNKEVALDSALYWNKEPGNLSGLINRADLMSGSERVALGIKAKERVKTAYSWDFICGRYAEEFLKETEK